jgi:hypothetical protein
MFEAPEGGTERAESLPPEPGAGTVFLSKFFKEVSGEAFVVCFGQADAEEEAGESRWISHGYTFCKSRPSSMVAMAL